MLLTSATGDLATLRGELTLLEEKVFSSPTAISLRTDASGWTPGEHLEHTLKALRLNLRAIARIGAGKGDLTTPPAPILARWVLLSGWIPAGSQAPKMVMPSAEVDADALGQLLAVARDELATFEEEMAAVIGLAERLLHPALGGLTPRQWLRFATVHTHHHRKIVDSIFRGALEP